jgi:hypothetical protein
MPELRIEDGPYEIFKLGNEGMSVDANPDGTFTLWTNTSDQGKSGVKISKHMANGLAKALLQWSE